MKVATEGSNKNYDLMQEYLRDVYGVNREDKVRRQLRKEREKRDKERRRRRIEAWGDNIQGDE